MPRLEEMLGVDDDSGYRPGDKIVKENNSIPDPPPRPPKPPQGESDTATTPKKKDPITVYEYNQDLKDEFLITLEARITLAGGRISIDKLKRMDVEDLLNTCFNNGIRLVSRLDRSLKERKL